MAEFRVGTGEGEFDTIADAIAAVAESTDPSDTITVTATYDAPLIPERLFINNGSPLTIQADENVNVIVSYVSAQSDLTLNGIDVVSKNDPDLSYPDQPKYTAISVGGDANFAFLDGSISVASEEEDAQNVGIDVAGGGGTITLQDADISGFQTLVGNETTAYGIFINGTPGREISITNSNFDLGTAKAAAVVLDGQDGTNVEITGNTFGDPGISPGSIRIFDLTSGSATPVFAEDSTLAYPNISDNTFTNFEQAISNETGLFGGNGVIVTAGSLSVGNTTYATLTLGSNDPASLSGGEGRDVIIAGSGGGTVAGGAGADLLIAGSGTETIAGGAGDDVIFGTAAALNGSTLDGFAVGDVLRFDDGTVTGATIVGGDLVVTFANSPTVTLDLVNTGAGTFSASGNNVTLTAPVTPPVTPPVSTTPTAGPDNITGVPGQNNTIAAGEGADTVNAGTGNDSVFGNQGNDQVFGNQGNDSVFGGQGEDSVYGGQGNDAVYGNVGNDIVYGNLGEDQVFGNEGDDQVFGNEGNDFVHGGQGNDSVYGGQGNDVLNGGAGDDVLQGGVGSDLFVFDGGQGADVVTDFRFGEGDRIDLRGQNYVLGQNNEGQATLFLEGGGTVVLLGLTPDQFQTDFVVA